MKQYLEIIETLTEEESLIQQPQMIRLEVMNKEEAIVKLSTYESLFEARNYTKTLHKCFHEEGKSCEVEQL